MALDNAPLYQALLERKPVDPLTDREPSITIEDAYQIKY